MHPYGFLRLRRLPWSGIDPVDLCGNRCIWFPYSSASCCSDVLAVVCYYIRFLDRNFFWLSFSTRGKYALLYRALTFSALLATLLQDLLLKSGFHFVTLQLHLPEVLGVLFVCFFYGELNNSLSISSSHIIDKWLYNPTSIFSNLATRMNVLLFVRFLVFTFGSPILVVFPYGFSNVGFSASLA